MANFGLYNKPYIKMGTRQTVCYCCIKDECNNTGRNAHDVTHEQLGKHENQMVFYIRRSGQDTCICLNCFKKLYEEIVSEEIVDEEPQQEVTAPTEETSEEASTKTPEADTTESKTTAKKNNNKTK